MSKTKRIQAVMDGAHLPLLERLGETAFERKSMILLSLSSASPQAPKVDVSLVLKGL